jgi:hypothetical protein
MGERADLLTQMQARLERFLATRDFSVLLEEETLIKADVLYRVLWAGEGPVRDPGDLPALFLLGLVHWYRSMAVPEERTESELQAAFRAFIHCFLAGMRDASFPEQLLPFLAEHAEPVAQGNLEQAQASKDPEALGASIRLWQQIVAATPGDHPDRARRLSRLGDGLVTIRRRRGWGTAGTSRRGRGWMSG